MLAPLPVERTASAIPLLAFLRAFAQTWGITIASTILHSELKRTLPAAFVARFPNGVEIAYAAIPLVRDLPEPLHSDVREAFAGSMAVVWRTMAGILGSGLLSVLLLKEILLGANVDAKFALEETQILKEGG